MKSKKLVKFLKYSTALILLGLILIEAIGRWGLGLCDVPLYIADKDVEYRLVPDQTCHLLGKHVVINHYSMRSDAIEPSRSNPRELRILLIGDSIVFGGNRVDQSELASQLIQNNLRKQLHRDDIVVCNISTSSWGPENQLAYLKRIGTFDHDLAVIVSSSDDVADVPSFEPIVGHSPDYPASRPPSAIWQIITRFGPRFFAIATTSKTVSEEPVPEHADTRVLSAVRDMVTLLRENNKPVVYAIHRTTWNLDSAPLTAVREMMDVASQAGATVFDMQPDLKEAMDSGQSPYRDAIHPNTIGQRVIAEAMLREILPILKQQFPSTMPAN